FILFFQGGVAGGSALWGSVGERLGLGTALFYAGLGTLAAAVLVRFWKLPAIPEDLGPWIDLRQPVLPTEYGENLEEGPVLVTVEYAVKPHNADAFLMAIHEYERVRRRDGATRWGIYHDTERPDRYIETYIVRSWAEH